MIVNFLYNKKLKPKTSRQNKISEQPKKICKISVECKSETKKQGEQEVSPAEKHRQGKYNGYDIVNHLREKSEAELEIKKSKEEHKRQEFQVQCEREGNSIRRNEPLLTQSQ